MTLLVSVSLRSIIHSYLSIKLYGYLKSFLFPSPYGVSFILIEQILTVRLYMQMFPSPYGVSFILMSILFSKRKSWRMVWKFPSPYGVLFILIKLNMKTLQHLKFWVSVSLRSIIHSYILERKIKAKCGLQKLSVSLRSIIHSYR